MLARVACGADVTVRRANVVGVEAEWAAQSYLADEACIGVDWAEIAFLA